MLPGVVAAELRQAVRDFLKSAFPVATPYFQGGGDQYSLIDDLIERPNELFKGPYVDIKLPFREGSRDEVPFSHLKLPFNPYQHQLEAFRRLAGASPQSTIIATGTGSGKTECFMLPVIDDCLKRREPGIKTIIIYPMNALATDQARRFAREVAQLDTRLTVGLYVGGEQQQASTTMGPDNVITCQKTLRKHPPDILLTNYKMLDFLMIRPKDRDLWRHNKPGMLRYLVVDELHTFDGAQGTDLACLIRRLRHRMDAGPELACIGTSATIGTESMSELLEYAAKIFAAGFAADAVIAEDRLSADEYLLGRIGEEKRKRLEAIRYQEWPDWLNARFDPAGVSEVNEYLSTQVYNWFQSGSDKKVDLPGLDNADPAERRQAAVKLGEMLWQLNAFHVFIRSAETLTDLNELADDWSTSFNLSRERAEQALISLISLISAARLSAKETVTLDDELTPFLQVRLQLWLRELRRMVCSVPADDAMPSLRFSDDLRNPASPLHLPLLHCRECQLAGWGAVKRKGDSQLDCELKAFYQAWFDHSPQARLLIPVTEDKQSRGLVQALCAECRRLQSIPDEGGCTACGANALRQVWIPDMAKQAQRDGQNSVVGHHDCPECGARDAMTVVGYRAATLTSVMCSRLFATPYNDDFKLIAFSDSVQDAAHRAGFLGANTWRQAVRQAMGRWLKKQAGPVPLKEMRDRLPHYWRDRFGSPEHFCGLFIAPNMMWMADYHVLTESGKLPAGSKLPEQVANRLAWECITEFGRRGTFGRSLERSGMAAVGFDASRLKEDLAPLLEKLREEIESLRDLDPGVLFLFVFGWFEHLRHVGAIYDPALDAYLDNKGSEYVLNRLMSWMPNYGRSIRPPAAVTLDHFARNFESLILQRGETWSQSWLKKTLGRDDVFAAAEARQIFILLTQALTASHWLHEREIAGRDVWMLNPERLLVEGHPAEMTCDSCRHSLHVRQDNLPDVLGAICLRRGCLGQYRDAVRPVRSKDYENTDPRRLLPAEHTGLLPRQEREAIERSFIDGDEPWDINLLSATPTLEMGIDIGALSSVFLCSVPPAQANYLQRIGRAGRKDGNALSVTVANGRNHDLYFYAEPLEMIQGAVTTPGVFLKAMAVLARQLLAFCFDKWTGSGIKEGEIPGQMRKVLDAVEHQNESQFPYNLLSFIRKEHRAVLDDFFGMFGELDDEARQYLAGYIRNENDGGLEYHLILRLQEVVKERQTFIKRTRELKKELTRLQALPKDESTENLLNELDQERSALLSLLSSMNTQLVLNFFTDEGLLPNYAFPEEGVTLRSVILRKKRKEQIRDGEGAYEKKAYVFQRPSQAALNELAPETNFFAVSHRLQVDQIDLALSEVEKWRFCARCQYSARVDLSDQHSACPRCGCPQWADGGQKHDVLRLRQVYSTVTDRDSRIGDESEQREPPFFNRQMLVDLPPDASGGGFRIKNEELPFGFEFVPKVTLREVNFGAPEENARTFSVAGQEAPRKGFNICRHCGKVQKKRPRKNEIMHGFTCKLRKDPSQATSDDFLNSLYLYRELSSEAIRILLPLSEIAYSDEGLHSFIAALNLGLRRYFRGGVQHLEITEMREPATAGSGERIYLLVYDRIPGATGYLKELMLKPENLFHVLELANDSLTRCECAQDPERDGCYRCIFAYRDSRNMETISRKGAAVLLAKILDNRTQLETVESLGEINTNVLIESQLEQRFIDALSAIPGARLSRQLVNGKAGSLLTVPTGDGETMPWLVEHQVRVGPENAVAVSTQIDVVLRPARDRDQKKILPIAVYTDGLQYHHNRIDDDVLKRMALLRSGNYRVWSLSWHDLPVPGKPVTPPAFDIMAAAPTDENLTVVYDRIAVREGWKKSLELRRDNAIGSFDWLVAILRKPYEAEETLRQRAAWRTFTTLAPGMAHDGNLRQSLGDAAREAAPDYVIEALQIDHTARVPGGILAALNNSIEGQQLFSSIDPEALRQPTAEAVMQSLCVHLWLDDRQADMTEEFRERWRAHLHAANQLQYLPAFFMSTHKAVASGALERALRQSEILNAGYRDGNDEHDADTWDEIVELSDLSAALIGEIQSLEIPTPEVGEDLTDDSGEVVVSGSEVDLCWPKQKIAITTGSGQELPDGWTVLVSGASLLEDINELIRKGAFE